MSSAGHRPGEDAQESPFRLDDTMKTSGGGWYRVGVGVGGATESLAQEEARTDQTVLRCAEHRRGRRSQGGARGRAGLLLSTGRPNQRLGSIGEALRRQCAVPPEARIPSSVPVRAHYSRSAAARPHRSLLRVTLRHLVPTVVAGKRVEARRLYHEGEQHPQDDRGPNGNRFLRLAPRASSTTAATPPTSNARTVPTATVDQLCNT